MPTSRTRESLRRTTEAVRVVANTPENAERLTACYTQAYLSDSELFKCLVSAKSKDAAPIAGLTEPWTTEDFQRDLARPHTVTLEVPDPADSAGPPLGFGVLDFASTDRASIADFRRICPRTQAADDELTFHSIEHRHQFNAAIDRGNILYLRELVSARSRVATTALLIALHQQVVEGRLGQAWCPCVGKCLDRATLPPYTNTVGNRRIKTLVESLGLHKVATVVQHRALTLAVGDLELPDLYSRREITLRNRDGLTATLEFAIYLGDTRAVAALADRCGTAS